MLIIRTPADPIITDLALLWLRTVKKHLKHCNYDSVVKFGMEGVGINTIILFCSDKN